LVRFFGLTYALPPFVADAVVGLDAATVRGIAFLLTKNSF